MRFLVLGLMLVAPGLVSAQALGCKPAGVPDCAEPTRVLLRAESLGKLEKAVKALQGSLDKGLEGAVVPAGRRNSCFNNKFTLFYISGAKDYAKKHKKLFCTGYIDSIERNAKDLMDPTSREWTAVTNAGVKAQLATDAAEVKAALDEFLGAHSK